MSKKIDRDRIASGDLDREEALYLQARGKLPKGYEIPPGDGDDGEPVAPKTTEGRDLLSYPIQTRKTPLEEQTVPTIGDAGGIVDDDDDSPGLPLTYETEDGWNNDLRRAELSRRGLTVSGTKEDMISRLRRSDSDSLNADDYDENES